MKRVVLACDVCGTTDGVFSYALRPVGSAAPEYRGELCRKDYDKIVEQLGATRGKPQRGTRAPMVAVDFDTGKPL